MPPTIFAELDSDWATLAGSAAVTTALRRWQREEPALAPFPTMTALVQLLLPGARALARRLWWLGGPEERAAAVVGALYERIRTYPLDRRPAKVAANALADVSSGCSATHPTTVPPRFPGSSWSRTGRPERPRPTSRRRPRSCWSCSTGP